MLKFNQECGIISISIPVVLPGRLPCSAWKASYRRAVRFNDLRRNEDFIMKDWKIIAIIAVTALATAAAVVLVLQKQSRKRRMRFDSTEFDDDDFMDDIAIGEQGAFNSDDLDVKIPDEEEIAETLDGMKDKLADAAEDAAEAVGDAAEKAADAVEEALED